MFETIEEDGAVRHLVFGCTGDEFPDYFSVGMLKENEIPGIISPSVTVHNGMDCFRYDISDHLSLREFLPARLSKRQLLAIYEGIIQTLGELDSYLLDISLLYTDLDHIFIRNEDNGISMLYLPFHEPHQSVHDLFKEIVFNAGFAEGGDGSYVTVILNALNDASDFSLSDFSAVIKRLGGKERAIHVRKYTPPEVTIPSDVSETPMSDKEADVSFVSDGADDYGEKKSFIKTIKDMIFGHVKDKNDEEPEYEVVGENAPVANYSEMTVMLTDEESMSSYPYLIRCSTGEKIVINKPEFRIGKDERYADYAVVDNAAISRAHAEITLEDGVVYIRDEDSLNHTYVNGVRIGSSKKNILNDKDVILLADEEYVFYR